MYFKGCPSWKETHQYLVEILENKDITIEITLRNIETNADAAKYEFPGSPTIKVNGADIFPTGQTNFALGCRVYNTTEGFMGSPTKKMIEEALENPRLS